MIVDNVQPSGLASGLKMDWQTYRVMICPLCEHGLIANDDRHFFRAVSRASHLTDDLFHMDYDMCKRCGLIYQYTFPTDESLLNYYKTLYRPGEDIYTPSPKETQIEMKRARDWVRWLTQTQDFEKEYYKPRGIPARHIDIGSSTGSLGGLLRFYGTRYSIGVEPGPWAKWSERHLHQVVPDMGNLPKELYRTFDLVTMSHTLEHFKDPVSELLRARRLMKPDGRILIAVPDIHRKFASIFAFPHLLIFSHRTLKMLLYLAGFEIVSRRFFGPDLAVIAKLAEPKYTIKPPLPFFKSKIFLFWRLHEEYNILTHWTSRRYWPESQGYPPKLFARLSFILSERYISLRGFFSTSLFLFRYLFLRATKKLERDPKPE